uniref:Uncharacterized protein n=1 Tax=Panagrolaimus superbus TaxID=310955 RepID=A0A914YRD4_9BILA
MVALNISIEVDAPQSLKNESFSGNDPKQTQRKMVALVKARMQTLGMSIDDYTEETTTNKPKTLSYVIINPPRELELEDGDIVYVLRAPVKEDARSKRINPRRGLRRSHNNISPNTALLTTYPEVRRSSTSISIPNSLNDNILLSSG